MCKYVAQTMSKGVSEKALCELNFMGQQILSHQARRKKKIISGRGNSIKEADVVKLLGHSRNNLQSSAADMNSARQQVMADQTKRWIRGTLYNLNSSSI